ncbi:endothelin-converting enzyme 1, partial [Caerostris extrusa]
TNQCQPWACFLAELNHAFDLRALDPYFQFNWTTFPNYVLRQVQRKALCFMDRPTSGNTTTMMRAQPTLIEDLSDHQGIHLAFKAYLRYLHEEGDEEILPGLPFPMWSCFSSISLNNFAK